MLENWREMIFIRLKKLKHAIELLEQDKLEEGATKNIQFWEGEMNSVVHEICENFIPKLIAAAREDQKEMDAEIFKEMHEKFGCDSPETCILEKCYQKILMTQEELKKELENLKNINPCIRGASYDYKKGFNDAQWEFYKLINQLIE